MKVIIISLTCFALLGNVINVLPSSCNVYNCSTTKATGTGTCYQATANSSGGGYTYNYNPCSSGYSCLDAISSGFTNVARTYNCVDVSSTNSLSSSIKNLWNSLVNKITGDTTYLKWLETSGTTNLVAGQQCAIASNCNSNVCTGNVCVAKLNANDNCNVATDQIYTPVGYACINGKVSAQLAANVACVNTWQCANNLTCDYASNTATSFTCIAYNSLPAGSMTIDYSGASCSSGIATNKGQLLGSWYCDTVSVTANTCSATADSCSILYQTTQYSVNLGCQCKVQVGSPAVTQCNTPVANNVSSKINSSAQTTLSLVQNINMMPSSMNNLTSGLNDACSMSVLSSTGFIKASMILAIFSILAFF